MLDDPVSQLRVAADAGGDGYVVALVGPDRSHRWRSSEAWPGSTAVELEPDTSEGAVAADGDDATTYGVTDAHRSGDVLDLLLDRGSDNWVRFAVTPAEVDGRGHGVGDATRTVWMTQRGIQDLAPKQRIRTFTEHGADRLEVVVDTREQGGWTFEEHPVDVRSSALACGDYAVLADDGTVLAAVERKRKSDLQSSISRGRILSQAHALSTLPRGAIVVECSYTQALRSKRIVRGRLADMVATVQATYPTVPLVFAGNRAAAEEWTFRYLAAAHTLDTA